MDLDDDSEDCPAAGEQDRNEIRLDGRRSVQLDARIGMILLAGILQVVGSVACVFNQALGGEHESHYRRDIPAVLRSCQNGWLHTHF